jgi:hypothetical protein
MNTLSQSQLVRARAEGYAIEHSLDTHKPIANTNSVRRRTQRSNALENDIIDNHHNAKLTRKQRRVLNMVAYARYQRLGHCSDRKQYDNRHFRVVERMTESRREQLIAVGIRPRAPRLEYNNHVRAFKSETWAETDVKTRYESNRIVLDAMLRNNKSNT